MRNFSGHAESSLDKAPETSFDEGRKSSIVVGDYKKIEIFHKFFSQESSYGEVECNCTKLAEDFPSKC